MSIQKRRIRFTIAWAIMTTFIVIAFLFAWQTQQVDAQNVPFVCVIEGVYPGDEVAVLVPGADLRWVSGYLLLEVRGKSAPPNGTFILAYNMTWQYYFLMRFYVIGRYHLCDVVPVG